MKLVTPELVLSFDPCAPYTGARLRRLLGAGRPVADVLAYKSVSPAHRVWIVSRLLTRRQGMEFLARVVDRALRREPGRRCKDMPAILRRIGHGRVTIEDRRALLSLLRGRYPGWPRGVAQAALELDDPDAVQALVQKRMPVTDNC